jgi:tryptophan synthase alpha chain
VDERIRQVAALGRGYLYYVSLKGVTGAANIDHAAVGQRIEHIRSFTPLPIGVGFGIRDAESAQKIARVADAVVIGSRLVEEIEKSPPEAAAGNVSALLRQIREAMDAAAGVRVA